MSSIPPDEDADVAGLAGLYALGALEGADLERFEAYLAVNPDAAIEVAGFTETAARIASIAETPAPASLRSSVLGSLGDVRQEPPSLDVARQRRRSSTRQRVAAGAAAAALVIVAAVGGYAIGAGDDVPSGGDELAALLAADDAAVVELAGDDVGGLRLVYSAGSERAVVVSDDLEPVPADRTYELWALRGDVPSSVGLFTPDADGVLRASLDADLSGADALAVTVEPAGGSETPTMPIVMSATV